MQDPNQPQEQPQLPAPQMQAPVANSTLNQPQQAPTPIENQPQSPNFQMQPPVSASNMAQPQNPVPTQPQFADKNGLRIAGGIISIVQGGFISLAGLVSIFISPVVGLIMLAVGIPLIVTGIQALMSKIPSKSAKLVERSGAISTAYTGVLFFMGLLTTELRFDAALAPLMLTIPLIIISVMYNKFIKNQAK